MSRIKTHYDTLKVDRQAPPAVIKAAYKALVQLHHPDKNPDDSQAASIMLAVTQAYEELIDPQRRAAHDAWIAEQERQASRPVMPPVTPVMTAPSAAAPRMPPRRVSAPPPRPLWTAENLGIAAVLLIMIAGIAYSQWREQPASKPAPIASTPAETPAALADTITRLQASGLDATVAPAPAADPAVYQRPPQAPNGQAWPMGPDYLSGMPVNARDGHSRLHVHNTGTGSDIYLRLVNADTGQEVRYVFVPLYDRFSLADLSPGNYYLKYSTLDNGRIYKTSPFVLSEITADVGLRASEVTVSLEHGGAATVEVAESGG